MSGQRPSREEITQWVRARFQELTASGLTPIDASVAAVKDVNGGWRPAGAAAASPASPPAAAPAPSPLPSATLSPARSESRPAGSPLQASGAGTGSAASGGVAAAVEADHRDGDDDEEEEVDEGGFTAEFEDPFASDDDDDDDDEGHEFLDQSMVAALAGQGMGVGDPFGLGGMPGRPRGRRGSGGGVGGGSGGGVARAGGGGASRDGGSQRPRSDSHFVSSDELAPTLLQSWPPAPAPGATAPVTVDQVEAAAVACATNEGGADSQPDFRPLIRLVGGVFADPAALAASFVLPAADAVETATLLQLAEASAGQARPSAAAGAPAASAESASAPAPPPAAAHTAAPATTRSSGLDLDGLARVYNTLRRAGQPVRDALVGAHSRLLQTFTPSVAAALNTSKPHELRPLFVTLLSFHMQDSGYKDQLITPALQCIGRLSAEVKSMLVQWLSRCSDALVHDLVAAGQQGITVALAVGGATHEDLAGHVQLLTLLNRANELSHERTGQRHVPFSAFYNEMVSETIDLRQDYRRWMAWRQTRSAAHRSFCRSPFLLDAAAKQRILELHSQDSQRAAAREAMMRGLLADPDSASPYLVLKVRRPRLVEDSLQTIVNMQPKSNLRRPLKVEFDGEEGVDEGGVRREYFQLIVEDLFTPKYGMFTEEPDTNTLWFNPNSQNSPVEWELVGSLIGIAIYNSVLLGIPFPTLVYRKLVDVEPSLVDLEEFRPRVARSLRQLLEYEGDDFEDVFCLDFSVTVDNWGRKEVVELMPNGQGVVVTKANRALYVERYVRWALVESVQRQFNAFRRGFLNVAGGPALDLFRAEELQLLVNGSKELDFRGLQRNTRYEGFAADSQVVTWLWEVVQGMTEEQRKQFLMFSTGSDRAPIRGLESLPFVVQRAGPDTDKLPTSHTCFFVLVLPEYSSKEKLQEKLVTAIANATGFGLL